MTDSATLATREYFAGLYRRCIADAVSGETRVNDLAAYVADTEERLADTLSGKDDHTFTFQQQRHYLMTGECVALLP